MLRFLIRRLCLRRSSTSSIASRFGNGSLRLPLFLGAATSLQHSTPAALKALNRGTLKTGAVLGDRTKMLNNTLPLHTGVWKDAPSRHSACRHVRGYGSGAASENRAWERMEEYTPVWLLGLPRLHRRLDKGHDA